MKKKKKCSLGHVSPLFTPLFPGVPLLSVKATSSQQSARPSVTWILPSSDLRSSHPSPHSLCPSHTGLLAVHGKRQTQPYLRAFALAAPSAQNGLPPDTLTAESLASPQASDWVTKGRPAAPPHINKAPHTTPTLPWLHIQLYFCAWSSSPPVVYLLAYRFTTCFSTGI